MRKTHRQDVSITAPPRVLWRRSLYVFTALVLCFSVITVKLAALQLEQHEAWQTLASEQQLADNVICDRRGQIVDCNGVVLAATKEVATIVMTPGEIPDDTARTVISDELSVLLSVDRATLYKKTQKLHSSCETVKAKIDDETATRFINWVNEHGYSGIFRVIRDYKREYPYGNLLSNVLGFVGTDNSGLEGLEAKYNDYLAGKRGRIITTKNGWGDPLPNRLQYETAIEAEPGNTLTLTVDVNVQQIAEKHLEQAVADCSPKNRAAVIVMDVKTGGILAMATKPDYDLNSPRALMTDNPETTLETLQALWKNKPVSEYYEPGSVFKIFTASTALEEKLVTKQSHFFCGGTFQMPGVRVMKCHIYPRSHGDQDLAAAISHSCNPAFMKIGSLIGTTRFVQYHQNFGFTERTGIDMLGEAGISASLYHTADKITAVDVATSSIGQTFKVTPIQMITGVCAVANGGNLMQPYTVSRITDKDGKTTKHITPTVRRNVISQTTSATMCELLEGVVDGGGAKNAYVEGYRVAGKTGTSEKTDKKTNGRKDVVASFCGFAPADDPKVAVLVMIDEPQTAIRYGGTLAAPVAQKIFADVLPYLGLEKR